MFSMMSVGFPYHFNKCIKGICSIVLEQGTWNGLWDNFNSRIVVLISIGKDAWSVWLLNLCSEWPKQIWLLAFRLLNPIQIFNYWPLLVTHCQYLSQIWANSQRFNLEQHQSNIINTNVGTIQCTGNIMHHVKHATAKKSINMLHSQRCEIWYLQNKRVVKYNIFQNIKFISNKHLSVAKPHEQT